MLGLCCRLGSLGAIVLAALGLVAATAGPSGATHAGPQGTNHSVHASVSGSLTAFPVGADGLVGTAVNVGTTRDDGSPTGYRFSDDFCVVGERTYDNPLCPGGKGHKGNDVYPVSQTPEGRWDIVAPEDGRIDNRGCTSGGGQAFWLTGTPSGKTYVFLHMKKATTPGDGASVSRGEVIGKMSNTGTTTCGASVSVHLHFEIHTSPNGELSTNLECPYNMLSQSFVRPGEWTHDQIDTKVKSRWVSPGGGRPTTGFPQAQPGSGNPKNPWRRPWGSGYVQDYGGGARYKPVIVTHATYGTGIIWGGIRDLWYGQGGVDAVGFPTNDGQGWEEHAWGSGIRADFNGGSFNDGAILHKSGLATASVHGKVWAKFLKLGTWYAIPDNPMGWLITSEGETYKSPSGRTGRFNQWERGFVIWDRTANKTWEVHGNISAKYSSIGGTGSFLGYPISDEHRHNGNAYSAFEGGCITGTAGSYSAYGWGSSQCGSKHTHAEGPNA